MDGGDIGGDPECKKVIEIHEAEQNKLNSKLEAQRARQEDVSCVVCFFFCFCFVFLTFNNFAKAI